MSVARAIHSMRLSGLRRRCVRNPSIEWLHKLTARTKDPADVSPESEVLAANPEQRVYLGGIGLTISEAIQVHERADDLTEEHFEPGHHL